MISFINVEVYTGQAGKSKSCDATLAEGPQQVRSKSPSDSHDSLTWSNKLAH